MTEIAPDNASKPSELLVHATTVALGRAAILLRGASGAGKSDLALRFLAAPPTWPIGRLPRLLVSDDQTRLALDAGRLIATAPAAILGKLEVRGVGIIDVTVAPPTELRLVVDLVATADLERLPESDKIEFLGVSVPLCKLTPFEASAPYKLALLLRIALQQSLTADGE
jgi:HPr kinase/phosphorylase